MRTYKKKSTWTQETQRKATRRLPWAAIVLMVFCLMLGSRDVQAASFGGDYRYWSQGGSDYSGMRQVGCLITAQAKMLYEANVNRSASFNPDAWYNWLLANGGIASSTNLNMRDHNAPVYYARALGKNLEYLGYWRADDAQLWYNINAGYYTIVHVSGTNTGGSHYVLLDNALSKQTGTLYCYDSFSDRGTVRQQLLTRYSIHNGGHVYKGNNAVHTHSYTSSITKQPTCTQAGVKTYRCSCGASYTEAVAAKGHSYVNQNVAPTMTERGYTRHTCSACGHQYKDNYIEPPKADADGWYYGATLPGGISKDHYEIQYQNYYEKTQQSSPGAGWSNAGVAKNEWQNVGNTYTSESDLQTSDARVLVRSVYYHYCGPNTGDEGNYEQTSKFVHYDEIASTSAIPRCLGTDNGHPYYILDWIDGGGRIWCKSGVSCDGTYGTHGGRCCAWYKMNTYQNRVKVVWYKFTKTSEWMNTKDTAATSVRVRFRELKPEEGTGTEKPAPENAGTGEELPVDPGTGEEIPENPGTGEEPPVDPGTGEEIPENPGTEEEPPVDPGTGEETPENPGTDKEPPANPGTGKETSEKPSPQIPEIKKPEPAKTNTDPNGNGTISGNSGNTSPAWTAPKATAFRRAPKAKSRAFIVEWKKQSGISGYQIQYSTSKSFRKGNTKTKTVKTPGATKLTVKKLKARKTYYVRIRTYKTENGTKRYSAWSKSKKVKTKR